MELKLKDIIEIERNSLYNQNSKDDNENYFFNKSKELIDSDIKKITTKNSKLYINHIIVCSTHSALYYFLLPLRSKSI